MNFVAQKLISWYKNNYRELPWRLTKDPYYVWLSEVILQQTRVEQGLPYYYRFIDKFPTIKHLAEAQEDDVLNLWQGLGYYSRGRNLHKTAQYIYTNLKGNFPDNYNELVKLKGIGPYTASAIASFCFNQPKGVLDGNVYRFLARLYGIYTPINKTQAKKEFQQIVDDLIPTSQPAIFNQAIMEYGALICTPKNAQCISCIFNHICVANKKNEQKILPVKLKAKAKTSRYFYFFILETTNGLFLEKRNQNDIWQNLYQPLLISSPNELTPEEIIIQFHKKYDAKIKSVEILGRQKHQLTHQTIQITYIKPLLTKSIFSINPTNYDDFGKLAFPQPVFIFLKKHLQVNFG